LENAESLDAVRGIEGAAAKEYFAALPALLKIEGDAFVMKGRSRRPPLDRINALLSFCYALLLNDCVAALVGAGLDPSVGFLHADRPGKPSLALDLMEEFRPLIADRLAITLINRKQVQPDGFVVREGGAVEMTEATRKEVVTAWRDRKKDQVTHQLLQQTMFVGDLPHTQAKILARQIRGDVDKYVPCTLK
jgi:CRISPR-associated protein Cas1